MANESVSKTMTVALLLCIACSALVSAAAMKLKPLQEENRVMSVRRNILMAADLKEGGAEELFKKIDMKIVDLATGEFDDSVEASQYDPEKAAGDPLQSVLIPKAEDIARIGRRAEKLRIYLIREEGKLKTIILPVYGKGLWSTMRAFLALKGDANTVQNLIFYEHGETPGMGGEVDNPLWKRQWPGKKIYDEKGRMAIEVLKGKADPSGVRHVHQIDGLSGASLTTRGVDNIMSYWLGEHGYGKFMKKLRGNSFADVQVGELDNKNR